MREGASNSLTTQLIINGRSIFGLIAISGIVLLFIASVATGKSTEDEIGFIKFEYPMKMTVGEDEPVYIYVFDNFRDVGNNTARVGYADPVKMFHFATNSSDARISLQFDPELFKITKEDGDSDKIDMINGFEMCRIVTAEKTGSHTIIPTINVRPPKISLDHVTFDQVNIIIKPDYLSGLIEFLKDHSEYLIGLLAGSGILASLVSYIRKKKR